MKWFILLLCLGCAMAIDHEKLLDELEEMLASKKDAKDESHAASIDENAETMFGNIVKSLESDDALPEDSPRDEVSSLYDRIFQDEDEMDKRMVAPKQPDYGLCMDGISIPEGPNQLGCSRSVCYDEKVGTCNNMFADVLRMRPGAGQDLALKRQCSKRYHLFRNLCPHTCGYCKPRSPERTCRKRYGPLARYGCCKMSGMPSLRKDRADCLPCRDLYKHVCKQFMKKRFGQKCNSNSYRMRKFFGRGCAVTCGRCEWGEV